MVYRPRTTSLWTLCRADETQYMYILCLFWDLISAQGTCDQKKDKFERILKKIAFNTMIKKKKMNKNTKKYMICSNERQGPINHQGKR